MSENLSGESAPTPESYEPESLAGKDHQHAASPELVRKFQDAQSILDEDTGDLTEAVNEAKTQEGGDAESPNATAKSEGQANGAVSSPATEEAPAGEDLAGPQPPVAPVEPQSYHQPTLDEMAIGLQSVLDLFAAIAPDRLDQLRHRLREVAEDATPEVRKVLRLARYWVSITPDGQDDKLLNKIDALLGNAAELKLFGNAMAGGPVPQQFCADGSRLMELLGLARVILSVVDQLKEAKS